MTADVAQACADLTEHITQLPHALTRDNTPGNSRTILSAGAVYNPDVLHAIELVHREIPATRKEACQLLAEPCPPRDLATSLRALPRLHQRLYDLAHAKAARNIEQDITHWTRVVKYALGLRTRDTPIGWNCPHHPEEPCELVAAGSEGFIRPDGTIHWEHAATIWCHLCGASWPEMQWNHLGRILETA